MSEVKIDQLGPGKDGFYEKSADRFASWVQYEDAKAGAVLVFLGLGLTDVLGNADTLIHAHEKSGLGVIASIAFWISLVAALATVAVIAIAIWPYTHSQGRKSIFFFKDVTDEYKTPKSYTDAVASQTDEQLAEDMAVQAWTLARIATAKVRLVNLGFWSVALFLLAWAAARIFLGLG